MKNFKKQTGHIKKNEDKVQLESLKKESSP